MASLSDVAQRAGVSVSTASSVLNPGAKPKFVSDAITARVRQAASELGYVTNYHARSMKLRRANCIGVVLDMPPSHATPRAEMGSSYFGTLFGAVAVAARHAGYTTSIVGASENARATWRGVNAVHQRQLDGVVLLAMLDESHTDNFYVQPPDIPAVAIEPSVKTPLPAITWDMAGGVSLVVEHLASLGHKSILWLGPVPLHGTTPEAQRELLFMQKMWDMGLKGSSCRYPREVPRGTATVGETYLDPARNALAALLRERPRPGFTAVACFNDVTALGAISALRSASLCVPGDVSVIGFDDTEAVYAEPKLTTVRLPLEGMGESAFAMLRKMIEGQEGATRRFGTVETLASELVVRQSTAAPR